MATRSGIPARTRLRTAVRRRSCGIRPGSPTEALHRREYGGTYLPRTDFEERVLKPLRAAVPSELEPSYREALRTRLKFADEYSFQKRLTCRIEAVSTAHVWLIQAVNDHRLTSSRLSNHYGVYRD